MYKLELCTVDKKELNFVCIRRPTHKILHFFIVILKLYAEIHLNVQHEHSALSLMCKNFTA